MTRVVMVVNNPATNDNRVVKSAELIARNGYDCHVVGILQPGFAETETINGVTYHRVPLKEGVGCILLGYLPRLAPLVAMFQRQDSTSQLDEAADISLITKGLRIIMLQLLRMKVLLRIFAGYRINIDLTNRSEGKLVRRAYLIFRILRRFVPKNRLTLTMYEFLVRIVPTHRLRLVANKTYSALRVVTQLRKIRSRIWKIRSRIRKRLKKYISEKLHPTRTVIGVKYLFGRYLNAFFPILKQLDADIYHAHELWVLESCVLISKGQKKPLIYDSHELERFRNIAWSEDSNNQRISYEEKYIAAADKVFAVSPGCAKLIGEQYNIDVPLLRNTPWNEKLISSTIDLKSELNLADETPLLVYTGSATTNRGLELVMPGLVELSEFHLVTVGPWAAETQKIINALADQLGVSDRFHAHPKVSPEVLIDFISTADIAVIPIQDACLSYRYCLPNKLFEAAFAGLPIVASDLPDLRQIIQDHDIGMVFQSDDVNDFVTIVKQVYARKDEFYRDEKIEKLRSDWGFEKEVEALLDCYRDLTAPQSSDGSLQSIALNNVKTG